MHSNSRGSHFNYYLLVVFTVIALILFGCSESSPSTSLKTRKNEKKITRDKKNTPMETTQTPRFRITNKSNVTFRNLVVLFPAGDVRFGKLPAGTTSRYRWVRNGVYRYAAYRFVVDGHSVLQKVTDFVGEKPMDGNSFTYVISTRKQSGRLFIRETSVTRDD